MLVTVFTPTYNRAYSLPKVYESLLGQTDKNFEWVLVDDGSTDGTEELVEQFSKQNNGFPIRYIKKENEGLNQTYNRGVDEAKGEVFFRVDSDDAILPDAIEKIIGNWHKVKDKDSLAGLVFLSAHMENPTQVVGYHPFKEDTECSFFDYRAYWGATGDRAEVIKTDVLRKYKFPKFGKEKFCPEAFMWTEMSKRYRGLYLNEPIYLRIYGEDAITADVTNVLKRNANGTTAAYAKMVNMRQPFRYFFRMSTAYYTYAFYSDKKFKDIIRAVPFLSTLIGLPASLLVRLLNKIAPNWRK